MRIQIRLFAWMADRAGRGELETLLPTGATVAEACAAIRQMHPDLPWPAGTLVAVNQEYTAPDHTLVEGDEVAVIPPVSGGAI